MLIAAADAAASIPPRRSDGRRPSRVRGTPDPVLAPCVFRVVPLGSATRDMTTDISGETLAAVSREMVRIKAQNYGKGASEAKTYLCDNFLFCVLAGGLTPIEANLLQHGDEALVREVRAKFQSNMDETFTDAVRRLTAREVLGYQSQVLFDPDYTVEIFVLGDRIVDTDNASASNDG